MDIRIASASDRAGVERLLRENGLPVPERGSPPVALFVGADGERTLACAGYERHGTRALLRSIAVSGNHRGAGHGTTIVRSVLERIEALGIREVFLVTLEAEGFFSRLGFRALDREAVPAALHASPEWGMHECVGGTWMRRALPWTAGLR